VQACVYSLPSVFHGDPRDYAWGADGLDNAITQASLVTAAFSGWTVLERDPFIETGFSFVNGSYSFTETESRFSFDRWITRS